MIYPPIFLLWIEYSEQDDVLLIFRWVNFGLNPEPSEQIPQFVGTGKDFFDFVSDSA